MPLFPGYERRVSKCVPANPKLRKYGPTAKPWRRTRTVPLRHFRVAEVLLLQRNLQSAANEFRAALSGDLDPKWTEVWAHLALGEIFVSTSQQERAVNEYKLARYTGDDTYGAQDQASQRLKELDGVTGTSGTPCRAFATIAAGSSDYTDEARIAELEGTVLLGGVIDGAGSAHDLSVLQPLGLGLDEKAVEAARRWSCVPGATTEQTPGTRRTIAVDFFLPSKLSRWHLVGVSFDPAENPSRPEFVSTVYPPGAGISLSPEIVDEASILSAIGRPATVTLTFELDELGRPVNIDVRRASDPMWARQAIPFVSEWRFEPGLKDGKPVPAHYSIDLLWGPRNLTRR